MNEFKRELKKEHKKELGRLSLLNVLKNAIPTVGFVLYILLVNSEDENILIPLLVYTVVTWIITVPYLIKVNKLTKEFNKKCS